MTHDFDAFAASSFAAERAGDAATALEYHQGIPMFRRSAHRVVLTQLAGLGEEMPPWLWARWSAYQCTRAEDPGTEARAICRAALDYTLATFHVDAMEEVYRAGGDPMSVIAGTVGEDWVYHQVCTYELGGLERFLDAMATGRLADQGAVAHRWIGARMGGYRVEPSAPARLVVRDLVEDRPVELLALGAEVHAAEGGWLIGRLVPSGTTPALMFDTRPLPVDEQTARQASMGDRRGAWVTALVDAIDDGRIDRGILRSEDRELVTDVPSLDLLMRATPPGARASALRQLADGRDEIGRAAYRILRAVAEDRFDDHDAPYVAAAVVNVHGYDEARRQLARPEHVAAWEHWSRVVAEPARGRLLRLAQLSAAAAA